MALRLGMTAWLAWMTIKTVRRLLRSLRLARMNRLLPPICVAMDLDVIEANYEFCGGRCGSGSITRNGGGDTCRGSGGSGGGRGGSSGSSGSSVCCCCGLLGMILRRLAVQWLRF